MGRKDRYLVGLDVGTSKVCAIVAEIVDEASLDVVGIGVAESRGIRRGVIVNLEAAVDICPTGAVFENAGVYGIEDGLCIRCDACREVAPDGIEVRHRFVSDVPLVSPTSSAAH